MDRAYHAERVDQVRCTNEGRSEHEATTANCPLEQSKNLNVMQQHLAILAIFTVSTASAQSLNDSLTAHFPLDGDAVDTVGGLAPTITSGTPTFCADRFGNQNGAACFDGASFWSYGDVLDVDTSDFSLSLWARTDTVLPPFSIAPGFTSEGSTIAGKGNSIFSDPIRAGYSLLTRNSSGSAIDLYGATGDATNDIRLVQTTMAPDEWVHLVLSRCGNHQMVFVNGSLFADSINSFGRDLDVNTVFCIGGIDRNPSPELDSEWFIGAVDDVRMYKGRCLSVYVILTLAGDTSTIITNNWLYLPDPANQERVDIGDLDITGNQVTVEALFSPTDSLLWPTIPTVGGNIVSKHLNPEDDNYLLRAVSFELSTSAGALFLTHPVNFCPDSVYHVAGTYDGATAKYYVNGNLVADTAWTGNLIQNNHHTFIGNGHSIEDEQYRGYIDEVRIWNVARSQAEIASNMYHLPLPTAQLGLKAYLRFENNFSNAQGDPAYDGVLVGPLGSIATNPFFLGAVADTGACSLSMRIPNESLSDGQLMIYPNPVQDVLTISADPNWEGPIWTTILDASGRVVSIPDRKLAAGPSDLEAFMLNVAMFEKGLYFVVVEGPNWKTHGIFIKD